MELAGTAKTAIAGTAGKGISTAQNLNQNYRVTETAGNVIVGGASKARDLNEKYQPAQKAAVGAVTVMSGITGFMRKLGSQQQNSATTASSGNNGAGATDAGPGTGGAASSSGAAPAGSEPARLSSEVVE